MRTLLRPWWIVGHLLALVAVLGFVRLGVWQLDRHGERSELRDRVTAGAALDTIDLSLATEESFRPVSATGTYDAALQTLVLRSFEGRSGYHVLTPLRGTQASVLVDRGWIPLDEEPPPPPTGVVELTGVLWPAETGSVPDELPAVVRRIDPAIHQGFADYPLRSDYLILGGGDGGGFPFLVDPPGIGLGPHLGYAGQWFLFAAVVLVGYPILLRTVSRRESTAPG